MIKKLLVGLLLAILLVGGLATPLLATSTVDDSVIVGGVRYLPGDEVVELRDQYSKTFYKGDDTFSSRLFLGSIHYEDELGNFKPIDTTIVASDKPNWDWEVTTGHWQLFIKNDLTVEVVKDDNTVKHRLSGIAYYDQSTKQYEMVQTVIDRIPVVRGNTIIWEEVLYGVDYKISYTNDSFKEDIVIKQTLRDFLNTPGHMPSDYGQNPSVTYLTPIFEMDWSRSLAMELGNGSVVNRGNSEHEQDIYFRSPTKDKYFNTNLVSYMPVDYATSVNPVNPDKPEEKWRYDSVKIRKRMVTDDTGAWLLAGIKFNALNKMPEGSIIFDPTETLRPDAAGDETNLTPDPTVPNWQNVDEASPDNMTTTNFTTSATYKRDLYELPNSGIGAGTINSIKIYFNLYGGGYFWGKPVLKSDSTVTEGTEIQVTTGFVTYDQTWNTDPAGGDWTWADIDALQIGVTLKADGTYQVHCTQVYVVVDYTPSAPDPPTDFVASDNRTGEVRCTWTKSLTATKYQLYRDGAACGAELGDVDTTDDATAVAGTITNAGTVTASDGTSTAYVTLSLAGETKADGTTYTYKVRAGNANGWSGDSNTDNGKRTVGSITYQWQRSAADSDASFSPLGGATTDPYNDTTAPANGDGRWYYCVVSATGASNSPQNSDHNRGYRDAKPGVTTGAATLVEETTATLNGEITYVGGGNATTRGFEWDIDSGAPYTNDWHGDGDFGLGVFDHGITSLTKGELYYYRAYAINPTGTGYGAEVTFLTKPDEPNTFAAAAAADDDVDLTWVNGTGSDTTYIVRKDGSYPTNRADGTNVYNGALELYHDDDVGLVAGHVYYYRAWSYATEGAKEQYSDAYDQDSVILALGLVLWYQPETIISGTTLIDRQGSYDGVITWGGRLADAGDFGVLVDSELTQVDDYWVGYTLKIKEVAGDAAPEGEEAEILDSTLATLGGTADSGGVGKDTLVDAELTQTTAYWAGATLTIVTTTDGLAPQGESKAVISWDLPTSTLTFAALTEKVDTGDTYTLTAANSLFFDNLTAVVGADARYEIWDGQTILWGSFPEGIKVTVGPLTAYTDPVSGAVGLDAPEVAGIPPEPSGMWGGAASSDLPMYDLFNTVATNLGWTADVLYVVAWFVLSIGLGVALLITTGSGLGAIAGVGIGMVGGMATGMLPVWVLIVYLVLAVTWLYTSRAM